MPKDTKVKPRDRQVLIKAFGAQGAGKSRLLEMLRELCEQKGYAIYIHDNLEHELLVDLDPVKD